jgi:hypothetical protein
VNVLYLGMGKMNLESYIVSKKLENVDLEMGKQDRKQRNERRERR